ncbi:MAG: tRNA (guanosine(37)-N1)-methyltransferase TrmD [Parcubacteria group bacterium CG22_combo_CG10-13_8_21_14_all_41_9]|nr:MAG: tRNA (guanosine(37)-N1)-methyltransferase TrmD [Parcubacteria group bacterium CG22_combo_CG10-13_8_21_14_all_41_9]
MRFDIITIFPNIFDSYLNESILGRAQKNGLVEIKTHDLRDYTTYKHRTVDDSPYGGGVGMVMMVEPIYKALMSLRGSNSDRGNPVVDSGIAASANTPPRNDRSILLTPRGNRFTQKDAQRLTKYDQLVFVAGRYEGVDNRVSELVDEEISIGDFVLNGGELPALAIIESVARLIPGVLGKDESSKEESFSDEISVEYPHYTRPEIFIDDNEKEMKVPEILLSGDHKKIENWRKTQRK